ncbi:MAG: Rieske (2Fe-2S) protein [Acidobacteriaceae bacterium]
MAQFVKLCTLAEAPAPGTVKELEAAGRAICLANIDGELSALDNWCPHRQGPLGQGTLEGDAVMCPWHAWAFNVKTGQAEHTTQAKVDVFPVKVEDENVLIEL